MPNVGQNVIFTQRENEEPYNGHREHPAVITCVHGESLVNLKVFFDGGPVEDRTSVAYRQDIVGPDRGAFWHEVIEN